MRPNHARRRQAHANLRSPNSICSVTISACLIVRNEEANLGKCLNSLGAAVDEIIVVDTGSTDRTIDIAREHGAHVHHFAWCDDFSAARNESLRHATGDWIIWVDADDELVEFAPGALRSLCSEQNSPEWGYWVDVRSPYGFTPDEEVVVRHWRIFRNHRQITFRGRIHEEPWPPHPIDPAGVLEQRQVRIDHWGYLPNGQVLQRKSDRNGRLLRQCLVDEPSRPVHYYNLGRHYIREGDDAAALEVLERGLELWFSQGQPPWSSAHSLLAFAAQAALSLGLFDKVLEIEARTPAGEVSAELLCNAGIALWKLGRREEAIVRLNRAWQDASAVKPQIHDRSKSTWHPLLMLSGLYDQIDQPQRAFECAQRAIEFAPDHPEILLALAYLTDKLGREEQSIGWLRQLLNGTRDDGFKAQGRRLLLDIAERTNRADLALEALDGAVHGIGPEQCVLLRAAACQRLGNIQGQYDALRAGCLAHPEDAAIRLALSNLLCDQGLEGDALNVLAEALDYPSTSPEVYRELSKLLAKQGRLHDAANAMELALRAAAGSSVVEAA